MNTHEEDIALLRKEIMPKLARAAFTQSIVILMLTLGLVLMSYFVFTSKPTLLGITDSGRVIPLVPLEEGHVNDSRVIGFAAECLQATFAHDFVNYKGTMNEASKCFTSSGTASLYAAMDPILSDIGKRRLVLSSTIRPPTVVRKGVSNGVHTWIVQTQMTLFKEGTTTRESPRELQVSLVIERVPLDESVRGIGLAKINVKPI